MTFLVFELGGLVGFNQCRKEFFTCNLMFSPAHEPLSDLSSVPAARGHKHLGSVSSGKPSPAPPAGSW